MSDKPNESSEISSSASIYESLGNNLFRLTLTENNKAEVFQYALSKLDQSQGEASAILQTLIRWSKPTASLFAPRSSSTILDTPFRLIFPDSALPSFAETGLYVRQYTALSYCWHSEEFLAGGHRKYGAWPISKPFVDAVLEDKGHARQGIWIDQLCIDQADTIDKQKSVAAMDIIYRSCIRLLVLLEDVFLDAREAVLHVKYGFSNVTYGRGWRPPSDELPIFASFYHKINAARWWDRAWCFHEFNVNEPWSDKRQCNEIHNATFITNGPNESTVKIKWCSLHFIMVTALQMMSYMAVDTAMQSKGEAIFVGIDRGDDLENGWRSSIMARHNGVSQKGCFHLEDKLSVMINMCGLGLAYKGPALQSKDEVLYFSALLALAAGEVYPLTAFHSGHSIVLNNRPTWLQRHLAASDTSIPRFKLKGLHGIHRLSMQEIELDLLFLRPPAIWREMRNEDLILTYEIFNETITTTQPCGYGLGDIHYTTPSEPDTVLDKFRRRFLAGCIINGYAFTARLWAQLKYDVVGPNYNQGLYKDLVPSPSLFNAARNLIARLLPVSTLLGVPAPSTFDLEDAHLFLTWLTDPRSMYYIGIYTYYVQCTLDDQKAFITAVHINEAFHDGSVEKLRAAVPFDLLGETCIPLRVWLLRPVIDERGEWNGKWKLVGKTNLLGEPDLIEEARKSEGRNDAVVKLERAVVAG